MENIKCTEKLENSAFWKETAIFDRWARNSGKYSLWKEMRPGNGAGSVERAGNDGAPQRLQLGG